MGQSCRADSICVLKTTFFQNAKQISNDLQGISFNLAPMSKYLWQRFHDIASEVDLPHVQANVPNCSTMVKFISIAMVLKRCHKAM